MKKILIGLVTLLVTVGAVVVLFNNRPTTTQEKTLSSEDFIQAITQEFPFFLYENKPIITIDSISRHDNNWYIVTITSLRPSQKSVPVKLIMVNTDNSLKTITGPDTHFTESELMKHNTPDSVILELQES